MGNAVVSKGAGPWDSSKGTVRAPRSGSQSFVALDASWANQALRKWLLHRPFPHRDLCETERCMKSNEIYFLASPDLALSVCRRGPSDATSCEIWGLSGPRGPSGSRWHVQLIPLWRHPSNKLHVGTSCMTRQNRRKCPRATYLTGPTQVFRVHCIFMPIKPFYVLQSTQNCWQVFPEHCTVGIAQ